MGAALIARARRVCITSRGAPPRVFFLFFLPANSNDDGYSSNLCEQPAKSHGIRSPSPKSLESHPEHIVVAVAGLKYLSNKIVTDEAFAKVLVDGSNQTIGDAGTVGPHSCKAGQERTGSIECKSTPQSLWSGEQDEHLLHLRDTAQLKWMDIASYFPGMTLDAVKGRYRHLDECRIIGPVKGDEPKSGAQRRKRTTYPTASTTQNTAKICRVPTMAKSCRRPTSTFVEHHSTPSRRYVIKQLSHAEDGALLAALIHEDASQRTSRCGRLVRHPFRHRPSEGYV